jgi:hypothetical protein
MNPPNLNFDGLQETNRYFEIDFSSAYFDFELSEAVIRRSKPETFSSAHELPAPLRPTHETAPSTADPAPFVPGAIARPSPNLRRLRIPRPR